MQAIGRGSQSIGAQVLACLDGGAAAVWFATLIALLQQGLYSSKIVLGLHVFTGFLLGILDEFRLLAFAFHDWLMMFCFLAPSGDECSFGLVCVMGAVYFWAGVFKCNSTWCRVTYREIIRQLLPTEFELMHVPRIELFAICAAIFESAIGLAILVSPWLGNDWWALRSMVVAASALTHLQILWVVGPTRLNLPQLWPWNLAMPLFALGAVNLRATGTGSAADGPPIWTWTWRIVLLHACFVLPVAHAAGWAVFGRTWDANLCFNVWSGNQPTFSFLLSAQAWQQSAPSWLKTATVASTTGTYADGQQVEETSQGMIAISIEKVAKFSCSGNQLNWRFPPERHIYSRVLDLIAEHVDPDVQLVEELPPLRGAGVLHWRPSSTRRQIAEPLA